MTTGEEMYEELWKLSAGPLVDVPQAEERVYYFPQGHMEQLEASTQQDLNTMKPLFDLPPKILCRVMNVRLQAEKETDEVYAQIMLMPEGTVDEPMSPDPSLPEPQRPKFHSFTKVLTASDTSTHGGFSVLRKHATECLPPLDMTQQTPTQELVAEDVHGYKWKFKHIFRGQPRRHLLTTGWSTFVTSKKLVAGDTFVFLRGENGELRVGVRRANRQQSSMPSSVISSHSMHLGVLATACHATQTRSMFTVYYKPRTSQFIISLNKYLEAMNNKFSVGMRFKMRFEGDDSPERRFSGTVVGVQDCSPHWKDSKWRSLVVNWDEPASFTRPDKVSPWEMEPFAASENVPQSVNKRPRHVNEISALDVGVPASNFWSSALTQSHEFAQSCITSQRNPPQNSDWPVSPLNGQMVFPVEQKKPEITASCRLFGIDLMSSSLPAHEEKTAPMRPINITKPTLDSNADPKSEISKLSEEKKQEPAQASPKEVQSKQINSSRSRTKTMYEDMKKRVEHVVHSRKVDTRHDHPTLVKVLQSDETEIMPNLIYVSREKNGASPHHFKAGALNTLLRVSSVMTNSPVILTLDCDMYSNNPRSPLHALCYFSDPKLNPSLGFVQFPQKFRGVNKNDIYASELRRPFVISMVGFDGLMGSTYVGTGCFFNRRAFYGPPTNLILPEVDELGPNWIADKPIKAQDISALAHDVAGCNYERNSNWGSKIGFRYGSLVEDYYTGYRLHCEGWRSIFCNPPKIAFYGDSPKCLIDVVSQQKRWTIGLLEVAFSRFSPITYGVRSTSLLTGMAYCQYAFWAFSLIPLAIHGFLPQVALLYGVSVFPKSSDPCFWLYIFLFLGAYGQDLLDFVLEGGTCHCWWNDQRMWLIRGFSSFIFGSIEFTLKTLNLSTHGFNLTSKVNDDDKQSKRYEQEMFDFGASSIMFFPITTVAIVNLLAFVYGLYGVFVWGEGLLLELMLVSFAVVNSLPIYMAMVLRDDDGKLPKNVCILAGSLACFVIMSVFFVLK
ncbi:unnamed protein product [Brassica oleracea]